MSPLKTWVVDSLAIPIESLETRDPESKRLVLLRKVLYKYCTEPEYRPQVEEYLVYSVRGDPDKSSKMWADLRTDCLVRHTSPTEWRDEHGHTRWPQRLCLPAMRGRSAQVGQN